MKMVWVFWCGLLLQVGAPGLVINEFSPRPQGTEGEWIEFFNAGERTLDLSEFLFWEGTERKRNVSPTPLELPPKAFVVLASHPDSLRRFFSIPDSIQVLRPGGWSSLNDKNGSGGLPADRIVLEGPGQDPDSLSYRESWLPLQRGRSVERVSPSAVAWEAGSWGWSAELGTPGFKNSLDREDEEAKPRVMTGPRRIAPGKGAARFSFRFPDPGTFDLTLLDPDGTELLRLAEAVPTSPLGEWVWSGTEQLPPRNGLYVIAVVWTNGTEVVQEAMSLWIER